jgi:hypothetical protein
MPRRVRFTETDLRDAVAASASYSETLRRIGLRPAGGNAGTIKKYIEAWNISTAHFDPYAASRGRQMRNARKPLVEILVEHSTYHRGHLKQRLYDEGLKQPFCEQCGQGEQWRGRRMAMILDHINGVGDDHRLENLQIVCPNCAATLDTHCGRQNRHRHFCESCESEFLPNGSGQRWCSPKCAGTRLIGVPKPETRKVARPPHAQLVREVHALGWSAVGRRYGVSDNAVRKWRRQYEREQARREAA